jgi:hypothetical protein
MSSKFYTTQKENPESQAAEQLDKPVFSANAMNYLKKTAKYMNIIFILCSVISGLCVLGGLINLFDGLLNTNKWYLVILVDFVITISVALFLFFIGSYLRDTAKAYKNFGKNPLDIRPLEAAIYFQKGFWRLTTISMWTIFGVTMLSCVIFLIGAIIE